MGDKLLTTAIRPRDSGKTGLPTTTDQASAIIQLTTTYLDTHNLLVHPRKLVRLANAGKPAPRIQKGELLHLEDPAVHLGITQATLNHTISAFMLDNDNLTYQFVH